MEVLQYLETHAYREYVDTVAIKEPIAPVESVPEYISQVLHNPTIIIHDVECESWIMDIISAHFGVKPQTRTYDGVLYFDVGRKYACVKFKSIAKDHYVITSGCLYKYYYKDGDYLRIDICDFMHSTFSIDCKVNGRRMTVHDGKHLHKNELTLDDVDWIYDNFYRHGDDLVAESCGSLVQQSFDPIMTTLFYYYCESQDINEHHMDYLYDVPWCETVVNGRLIVVFFGDTYMHICTKLKYARVTSVFTQQRYMLSHTASELASIVIPDLKLARIFTDYIAAIQPDVWDYKSPSYMHAINPFGTTDTEDTCDQCEVTTETYTNHPGLLYNTDVIINKWGDDSKTVKVTYEQKSPDGTVVNNSTSYYEGGKKIDGFTIRPDGKFSIDVLDPESYNVTGIIGYKVVKNGVHQVIVVLDVPQTSHLDTGDHQKYRTDCAKVIDMFIPQFDKCTKCKLNTVFYDTSKNEFRCSKHISGLRSTSMVARCHVTEGYSVLHDSTYRYRVGQYAIPTNGGFKARSKSCGIGIHFCKEYVVLAKYIGMSYINHPLDDIQPRQEQPAITERTESPVDTDSIVNSLLDPHMTLDAPVAQVALAAHEPPETPENPETPETPETSEYRSPTHIESTEPICVICHDEYGDEGIRLLCGHTFHRLCIDNWCHINNICPTCRQVPAARTKKHTCIMM